MWLISIHLLYIGKNLFNFPVAALGTLQGSIYQNLYEGGQGTECILLNATLHATVATPSFPPSLPPFTLLGVHGGGGGGGG